jgi:hypothetical protein
MQTAVERAISLKQALVDFVYDAEGELAVALETYAAAHRQNNSYGIKQQNISIDTFITRGKVNERTPLEFFLATTKDLTTNDRQLVTSWQHSFTGLFEIAAIEDNRYEMTNWLTAKKYVVYAHSQMPVKETSRWKPGEIIVTRLASLDDRSWFFFSDYIIKGRLSKPKLAVAIGEFKNNYPDALYDDAPELLEEAWDSVAQYHREFVDYLGNDRLTLPGYKLNQKIGELQQKMSRERLAAAGIDDSKSLSEILESSGADKTEIIEAATEFGAEGAAASKILQSKQKLSMITPKVELSPEIKQAEAVTVFSHPRWGQLFVTTYQKFTNLLKQNDLESQTKKELLIRKYLDEPEINYYVWQQLIAENPQEIERLLQQILDRPNFKLKTDLDALLLEYHKPAEPQLPEIASVPIHLNNLFEEAVAIVQKSKPKTKKKSKSKGFSS